MNKGAIVLVVLALVVALAIVFVRPLLFERQLRDTSDASGATSVVRIGGDDYGGYWFFTSPEMTKAAPRKGFTIDFTNDGGAYAERLQKFEKKEYDAIVLPVNSYLQHGSRHGFPGVVVAAISESRGADAIVGFADVLPDGQINGLNNPDLRIAYTAESPSSFLLDLLITDFGMDALKEDSSWRRELGTARDVYKEAKKAQRDRTAGDAFVLWEPYVTTAIEKLGMQKLWGSDQFGGYIVDVLVVHRNFVKREPELVKLLLGTYFRVLETYSGDTERMAAEMSRTMHLKKAAVEAMIEKIDWFDLHENCTQFFGIAMGTGMPASDMIYSSIIQCGNVMENVGTYDNSVLRDPYTVVNSGFLEQLKSSAVAPVGNRNAAAQSFDALSDGEWERLRVVGTMRIEPISFQHGTRELDDGGKEAVDKVAVLLSVNYPSYRVAIRGHTGPGDEKANMRLSMARAEVVAQRLIAVHSIDRHRLHAEGYGATRPPRLKAGESQRSLRFRMPRVEFVLLQENKL